MTTKFNHKLSVRLYKWMFLFSVSNGFFPLIFKLVLLTTELDYIYNIIKRNSKIDAHYTNV